jgi:hypothetical protein
MNITYQFFALKKLPLTWFFLDALGPGESVFSFAEIRITCMTLCLTRHAHG